MCENPLISVVVPIFNVEKYLERCVQSIRCQTYSNIEIILVDDGSLIIQEIYVIFIKIKINVLK